MEGKGQYTFVLGILGLSLYSAFSFSILLASILYFYYAALLISWPDFAQQQQLSAVIKADELKLFSLMASKGQ